VERIAGITVSPVCSPHTFFAVCHIPPHISARSGVWCYEFITPLAGVVATGSIAEVVAASVGIFGIKLQFCSAGAS
ncbi:MAG: hypothetical protein K2K47_05685, partial [Duncaniella sp.]|nr:hypothetical protein [Duncaniella sp.]